MGFADREESRHTGAPVFLYFFRYGPEPDSYFAYTNAERAIGYAFDAEVGLVEFQPIPIGHGSVVSSGTLDRADLDIRVPHDVELSMLVRLHPPSWTISLTIFKMHDNEDGWAVGWAGRILGNQLEEEYAVFTGQPITTALQRIGLRRSWQLSCPHVLYGPRCRADKEAATTIVQVQEVVGAILTLPVGWETADRKPKYTGGLASWVNASGRTETRQIIRVPDPTTVLLSGFAYDLLAGGSVSFSLGCDHWYDSDCTQLHNNVHNYGGQFAIPTKNPIGITNNFY